MNILPCSLIRLFEAGILEKMTNAEYELMITRSKNQTQHETPALSSLPSSSSVSAKAVDAGGVGGGSIGAQSSKPGAGGGGGGKVAGSAEAKMKPITLRALQGAFIALGTGALAAAVVFVFERQSLQPLWCRLAAGRRWAMAVGGLFKATWWRRCRCAVEKWLAK